MLVVPSISVLHVGLLCALFRQQNKQTKPTTREKKTNEVNKEREENLQYRYLFVVRDTLEYDFSKSTIQVLTAWGKKVDFSLSARYRFSLQSAWISQKHTHKCLCCCLNIGSSSNEHRNELCTSTRFLPSGGSPWPIEKGSGIRCLCCCYIVPM